MSPRSPVTGYVFIVLAAVLWGTLGIVSRSILESGVEPLELSFWRAMIAGTLFAAQALSRGRVRIDRGDWPAVFGFAVVGVSVFYLAYLFAVRTGGAALAAILLYTAPAWVAVAAAIWLHESLTGRKTAALASTLVGVACVALGASNAGAGIRVGPAALGWGLLSGLAYACYYLFGKRYFTRYEAATLFMYVLPIGALLLLPGVRFTPKSGATWGWIVFVGVVPTYLALQCYEAGLKRVEATRAVTVATIEPVVAAALAYLVWGEVWGPLGYVGAALVLAGVLLMSGERTALVAVNAPTPTQ
jgi:DME family drug/metabolite transporter